MPSDFTRLFPNGFMRRSARQTSVQEQGWDGDPRGAPYAHRRANRLRQDAGGLPQRNRRARPEGLERPLPDEVRVVYVSPLKALSADIHKNLADRGAGSARWRNEWARPAANYRGRADRRHDLVRARGDARASRRTSS
jgi:hypothetical protein